MLYDILGFAILILALVFFAKTFYVFYKRSKIVFIPGTTVYLEDGSIIEIIRVSTISSYDEYREVLYIIDSDPDKIEHISTVKDLKKIVKM